MDPAPGSPTDDDAAGVPQGATVAPDDSAATPDDSAATQDDSAATQDDAAPEPADAAPEPAEASDDVTPGYDEDLDAAIEAYWQLARKRVGITRLDVVVGQAPLATVVPPAWAFGGTPEEADALLELVLAGRKTATTSALWEYEDAGAALPSAGDLSIVLDGAGRPRALLTTTAVAVVPLGEVDDEHVHAEAEGDAEEWRAAQERLLAESAAATGRTVDSSTPVVLERFRLLDPKPATRASGR